MTPRTKSRTNETNATIKDNVGIASKYQLHATAPCFLFRAAPAVEAAKRDDAFGGAVTARRQGFHGWGLLHRSAAAAESDFSAAAEGLEAAAVGELGAQLGGAREGLDLALLNVRLLGGAEAAVVQLRAVGLATDLVRPLLGLLRFGLSRGLRAGGHENDPKETRG